MYDSYPIFQTQMGRSMATLGTEFIVIKSMEISPFIRSEYDPNLRIDYKSHMQFQINNTEYFLRPDGSRSYGISNKASPLPNELVKLTIDKIKKKKRPVKKSDENDTDQKPQHSIERDDDEWTDVSIYVLPGQRWEFIFTIDHRGDKDSYYALDDSEYLDICIKYTLYDGTDAVLANQLLEMGITVKPSNVDKLRRRVIEQDGGSIIW
jgi:hypothetical protein